MCGGRFPRISEVELTEFSAVSAVIFIFFFSGLEKLLSTMYNYIFLEFG